jgi:hypothetical protein
MLHIREFLLIYIGDSPMEKCRSEKRILSVWKKVRIHAKGIATAARHEWAMNNKKGPGTPGPFKTDL